MPSTPAAITINGEEVALPDDHEPRTSLGHLLRGIGLTSVKIACEQGICGACTVLVDGLPVKSCIVLALQAAGHEVTTLEGHADDPRLERLRVEFHEGHALQCGFCTPGMLLSALWYLRAQGDLREAAIRDAISGDLCRCTGYQPIVEAIERTARSERS